MNKCNILMMNKREPLSSQSISKEVAAGQVQRRAPLQGWTAEELRKAADAMDLNAGQADAAKPTQEVCAA